MRRGWAAVLILAGCNSVPPDHELRFGLTKEEVEAGPSWHHMKGALLNDIRIWRELEKRLDQGAEECTALGTGEGGALLCLNDKEEFEVYPLRRDLPDEPYRVDETALYCPREKVYYYHYVGGPAKRDVWLGPYKLERTFPKLDSPE